MLRINSRLALIPLRLLSAKSHARLACSVVNALATARCRYQLFAGCAGSDPSVKGPGAFFRHLSTKGACANGANATLLFQNDYDTIALTSDDLGRIKAIPTIDSKKTIRQWRYALPQQHRWE